MHLSLAGGATNLVQHFRLAIYLDPDRVALELHKPRVDVGMSLSPCPCEDLHMGVSLGVHIPSLSGAAQHK